MNPSIGKLIIGVGILLVLAGIVIYLFSDKLHWLGNLPGDIRIKREGFSFYFPLTTCIILTVLLNVILWLIRRFL